MIEKQNKRILFAKALTFALLALMLLEMLLPVFTLNVSAEGTTTTYSNVLDDLKKDETFNPEDYPAKADDYSLQVIQVAEGSNGELFVYVYQPNFETSNMRASYINFSMQDQTARGKLTYKLYSLTFLNSSGTLCKYIVNGFSLSEDATRYYSVAGIYRPFIDGMDDTYEAVEGKNYKVYEVGKMWTVYLYNDSLLYDCVDISIARIDITVTGELYYENGYFFTEFGTNSHFFGFNVTNYNVTHIFDADVSYKLIPYVKSTYISTKVDENRDEIYEDSKTLYEKENVTIETVSFGNLNNKTYTWKRIQTKTEFLTEVDNNDLWLDETTRAGIENCQYVFRVAETEYIHFVDYSTGVYTDYYYGLANTGVLRLHFATPEGTYNIGAVSDLVATDGEPNGGTQTPNPLDWLKELIEKIIQIISFVVIICVLIFLSPYIKIVVEILWSAIKIVATIVSKIITFPFKLIGALFKQK